MRSKEFDVEKLRHYRLIQRVLASQNKLRISDFDLLIYLYPIKYFTQQDFKDGVFIMSWDQKKFYRLTNEGWIKKVYEGRGYKGGHNKYSLTQKAKLLISKIGRIIDGRDDLPKIRVPKNYAERVLNTQVERFNKEKYIDYESDERFHG